jgi:hypothetical protein
VGIGESTEEGNVEAAFTGVVVSHLVEGVSVRNKDEWVRSIQVVGVGSGLQQGQIYLRTGGDQDMSVK